MRELGSPFTEEMVWFDDVAAFTPNSTFAVTMREIYPTASVPVLIDDDLVIADTMAITEYLAEKYPEAGVLPRDKAERAAARVLIAVMHSGFNALRHHCMMNIEAHLQHIGPRLVDEHPALKADIAKLEALLTPHLTKEGFLFGQYSAADAFYAPVMSRIKTYGLPISSALQAYKERVLTTSSFKAWEKEALQEHRFLKFEEPYRSQC